MIIPDTKKATTVILSRMKDGMSKDQPMKNEAAGPDAGIDPGLMAATQDIMQAFHEKSMHGLCEGLKSFIDQYEPSDESSESEE